MRPGESCLMGAKRRVLIPLACVLLAAGCTGRRSPLPEVRICSSLEADIVEPIFQEFTRDTGIKVRPTFDAAPRTADEWAALLDGGDKSPPCDLFWNTEILSTILLARRGLLAESPSVRDDRIPAMYRSTRGQWHAFAAHARVLLVNTAIIKEEEGELPRSVRDLADPRWKGRIAIGRPLAGSAAAHAACLFTVWGSIAAEQYFRDLKDNRVQVMTDNRQVALAVGSGQIAFGLTDSDDALAEVDKSMPVAVVYPDQGVGQMGTLLIPNTISILEQSKHRAAAMRLVQFVLSQNVEAQLALARGGQIPLDPEIDVSSRLKIPDGVRPMDVDFERAAELWPDVEKFLRAQFVER